MKQTAPSCLQVEQPSKEQPSEEQQAAEGAVLAHKSAGPGTAHASALSHAGITDALRVERQAARLQAEQEQAALQALLQKLESSRQLRVAALQDVQPLGAAALQASRRQLQASRRQRQASRRQRQASRRQLQQQVALQRRRHQEARYAELCAQHKLALAEGVIDSARAGEQPPRFDAAAQKAWQELPQSLPSHPHIAHRGTVPTQGPSNPFRAAWRNGSLPKSRCPPGPAAAVRPHPAGSVASGCPASAGATQAPLLPTPRLPAQPGTTSEQLPHVSGANVQQQPVIVADSTLQCEDKVHAEVNPQVRIAATSAIDHVGFCIPPCRGHALTLVATCSCAAKASQDHRACPGM